MEDRKRCVGWWLQQRSISWIARRLRRSREWVYKWIWRYRQGEPTWFLERSRRPHQMARRVSATFEQAVIRTHARLTSPRNPLGLYGAEAIAQELADAGVRPVHSIRAIPRILARRKLVTRPRRDRSRRGPNCPRLRLAA
ncbi:helix-turn-helix domain-containing protein [Nitrospira sp. BLG_2]|uniref:helix-turn-helix domain-containing protein n=1 Tax=Nitrospira sp. BLG_2 TaxID=3397507 RepID=UPI003B9A0E2D